MSTNKLRAHLEALIAGTAPQIADQPSKECLEISQAIAECVHDSLHSNGADCLVAPSALLPPLP